MATRYAHTNLIARDWKRLSAFYQAVFECVPVPPERNLSGEWLDRATRLSGAHIFGVHLRLPGRGDDGPTLEILQYNRERRRSRRSINQPGLAHLAFSVDDVESTLDKIKSCGGSNLGKIVSHAIEGAGNITFVYASDPEGNFLELQRWERL